VAEAATRTAQAIFFISISFLVGRGGGLGRSGRTIESTGAGEERRRGRLLLCGLLCVLAALPEERWERGAAIYRRVTGLILGSGRHVEELPAVHACACDRGGRPGGNLSEETRTETNASRG
jgi:hypothetical protein